MEIMKIPIAELQPSENNPRIDLQPGDVAYDQLDESIEKFGYVSPLIKNKRTGRIVHGHQRLKVLSARGYTEIEVVLVDLSPEDEMKLNIALNKITGEWDNDKLGKLLQDFMKDPDFSPQPLGFEWDEVTKVIENLTQPEDDDFDLDKELEAVGGPITQPGDVIELGRHRIACGDSLNPEVLKILFREEKVTAVNSDFPYGVRYDNHNRPGARHVLKVHWDKIENDELSGDEHAEWCRRAIQAMKPHLKAGAAVYLWDGFRNFGLLTQVLIEEGFHVSNVISWIKPSGSPSFGDYWFQSEFCIYGWLKGEAPHNFYGRKGETNVWEIDRELLKNCEHPTVKPVELARRVLRNSTGMNDIVFDGCMGSGFNLLACEQMGRVFRGVEIEPRYVDVTVRRYLRMFGRARVSPEVLARYGKELNYAEK